MNFTFNSMLNILFCRKSNFSKYKCNKANVGFTSYKTRTCRHIINLTLIYFRHRQSALIHFFSGLGKNRIFFISAYSHRNIFHRNKNLLTVLRVIFYYFISNFIFIFKKICMWMWRINFFMDLEATVYDFLQD